MSGTCSPNVMQHEVLPLIQRIENLEGKVDALLIYLVHQSSNPMKFIEISEGKWAIIKGEICTGPSNDDEDGE